MTTPSKGGTEKTSPQRPSVAKKSATFAPGDTVPTVVPVDPKGGAGKVVAKKSVPFYRQFVKSRF